MEPKKHVHPKLSRQTTCVLKRRKIAGAGQSSISYSSLCARGGVLEPEGTVEIKFRRKDLNKVMHRLDPRLKQMSEEAADSTTAPERKTELQSQIKALEDSLAPVYHSVAVQFADLHDTSGRMEEKGVISVSEMCTFVNVCLAGCLTQFKLE